MMKEEGKMSCQELINKAGKDAIHNDTKRISDSLMENYKLKRKENLKHLNKNPSQFDLYKALADAKHEALLQFKREFKGQRFRLIIRNAEKAEEKRIWQNSDEYRRQQLVIRLLKQFSDKKKIEQSSKADEQLKIEIKDPLSGMSKSEVASNWNENGGKMDIKMTTSDLVNSGNNKVEGSMLWSEKQPNMSFSSSVQFLENTAGFNQFPITNSGMVESRVSSSAAANIALTKEQEESKKSEVNFFNNPTISKGSNLFNERVKDEKVKQDNPFVSSFKAKDPKEGNVEGKKKEQIEQKQPESKTPSLNLFADLNNKPQNKNGNIFVNSGGNVFKQSQSNSNSNMFGKQSNAQSSSTFGNFKFASGANSMFGSVVDNKKNDKQKNELFPKPNSSLFGPQK